MSGRQFDRFFRLVHGRPAGGGLSALAECVSRPGAPWPEKLGSEDLREECGLADLAVFALARSWRRQPRSQPLRFFFVSYRSRIFDPLLPHARRLAAALERHLDQAGVRRRGGAGTCRLGWRFDSPGGDYLPGGWLWRRVLGDEPTPTYRRDRHGP